MQWLVHTSFLVVLYPLGRESVLFPGGLLFGVERIYLVDQRVDRRHVQRIELVDGLWIYRYTNFTGFRMHAERRFEQMIHSLADENIQSWIRVLKHYLVNEVSMQTPFFQTLKNMTFSINFCSLSLVICLNGFFKKIYRLQLAAVIVDECLPSREAG